MKSKVWYYFVVMSDESGDEQDRFFGPFEDEDRAEFFALMKPNETLDRYKYCVKEMTNPVFF